MLAEVKSVDDEMKKNSVAGECLRSRVTLTAKGLGSTFSWGAVWAYFSFVVANLRPHIADFPTKMLHFA